MPRGRVRYGTVGHSKPSDAHHGTLSVLLEDGVERFPSTPHHTSHGREEGEKKSCLPPYHSAFLMSSLVHPNVSLSSFSSMCYTAQPSPPQNNSTELPSYPNWSPLTVRLEGYFPIEPTAPENVRLPPYASSQDYKNALTLRCCHVDGSINVQKILQMRNTMSRQGQSRKVNSPSKHPDFKTSQRDVTVAENSINSSPECSPNKDVVTFCCRVHFNLKNIGLRDVDTDYLLEFFEATLLSLLASKSKKSSSCSSSPNQPHVSFNSPNGASENRSQSMSSHDQSTAARLKSTSEDSDSFKQKEFHLSDGVFFFTLDLSENYLTCKGIERLANWFSKNSRHIRLRVLKVYKNSISDNGAFALAELIREQPSALEELHLSHNRIHTAGAEALFRSIGEATIQRKDCKECCEYLYPRPGPSRQEFLPVWIRLEYNYINDSCTLLQRLEAELRESRKLDASWRLACFADRPNALHCGKNPHCSPARCLRSVSGTASLLHLYSFYHQSTVPRSGPGMVCSRTQERGKNKVDGHLCYNSHTSVFPSGNNSSGKAVAGRKTQRPVGHPKSKAKQDKQSVNESSQQSGGQPHQGKKKSLSKFHGRNEETSEVSPRHPTTDSVLERCRNTPMLQQSPARAHENGAASFGSSSESATLDVNEKNLNHFDIRDNDTQNASETHSLHNQSAERQFENKQDWLLEKFAFNCQASQPSDISTNVFSFPNSSVKPPSFSSETLKTTSYSEKTAPRPHHLELLDSSVVLVSNILHPSSDHSNTNYSLGDGSGHVSMGHDFSTSAGLFPSENDISLSNCLRDSAPFNGGGDQLHITPLSSMHHHVEAFQRKTYGVSEKNDSHHEPFRINHLTTGAPSVDHRHHNHHHTTSTTTTTTAITNNNKKSDTSDHHDPWNTFRTCDDANKHPEAHKTQSTQGSQCFFDQTSDDPRHLTFNKDPLKGTCLEKKTDSDSLPGLQSDIYAHDDSTLYIFIDSSAYLNMRKLFTEGNPNIFSFPALAALQQSGALVRVLSSHTRTPVNGLNNIILIYLDVVKDRVKKITEDMPFLRQSILETQNSFVNFLHGRRVIEKVKGLGNKDSFPDWTTWNKDVFYQAKLLEDTAFESLRVLDFACVWEYHLNVLAQCNTTDSTSSKICRPFSIFVTGDPKVENFLVFLSQHQENLANKSRCSEKNYNHNVNLVCTHIDRLNHRILQAFPDLAKALKQHEFLEKDSSVTFVNTPLESIFSAFALRKMMRKYFHISPDVLLNTTELISSLKEPPGMTRCSPPREPEPTIPSFPQSSLDRILNEDLNKRKLSMLYDKDHAQAEATSFTPQEHFERLREMNHRLLREVEQAYLLVMEILKCDISRPNEFNGLQKVVVLRKDLLQHCLYQCKHWETLLSHPRSV